MIRITNCPHMTSAVYHEPKATKQSTIQSSKYGTTTLPCSGVSNDNIHHYRHCAIYGVESWSGVLEWSHGVESWSGFWSGMKSDLEFCCASWTGFGSD